MASSLKNTMSFWSNNYDITRLSSGSWSPSPWNSIFCHLSYLWNIIPFWLAISLKNHTFNKAFEEASQSPLGASCYRQTSQLRRPGAGGESRYHWQEAHSLHISASSIAYTAGEWETGTATSSTVQRAHCLLQRAPTPQLAAGCEHTSASWLKQL